jgi:hypothetical protein
MIGKQLLRVVLHDSDKSDNSYGVIKINKHGIKENVCF